jgi:hypothetical protein
MEYFVEYFGENIRGIFRGIFWNIVSRIVNKKQQYRSHLRRNISFEASIIFLPPPVGGGIWNIFELETDPQMDKKTALSSLRDRASAGGWWWDKK